VGGKIAFLALLLPHEVKNQKSIHEEGSNKALIIQIGRNSHELKNV
jgi:hypothetical protein